MKRPGYKALVQFGDVVFQSVTRYRVMETITRSGLLWDCWIMAIGLDFYMPSMQIRVQHGSSLLRPSGSVFNILCILYSDSVVSKYLTLYWGSTGGAVKAGGAAPVGATSAAAAEVGAGVVSTTGALTSVGVSVPCFFSTFSSVSAVKKPLVTHSNSLGLLVHIQNLLGRGGVERVNSLSDASTDSFRVVVVESSGYSSVLVNLLGLGKYSVGVFVQFTGYSLVLANDLASDSVVDAVEEVEESARDTLLFWSSACGKHRLRKAYGQSR